MLLLKQQAEFSLSSMQICFDVSLTAISTEIPAEIINKKEKSVQKVR